MAIHCQLLFTTILYSLVVINTILEISTLAYSKSDNSGSCFLFVRDKKDKPSALPCTTNIYVNGGVTAYAVIMTIYHGYGTMVASRENHIGRTMWVMPWLLSNALAMSVIFISASVYSIGLYITCSNVTEVTRLTENCSIKNSNYRTMFICGASAWINVFLWICLIAVEAVRLRRNRRALAREVYADPNSSDVVKIGNILPTA